VVGRSRLRKGRPPRDRYGPDGRAVVLEDYFSKLSLEDLQTMKAILLKYRTDNDEISARSQIALGAPHDSG
jgi:hypothetical protein